MRLLSLFLYAVVLFFQNRDQRLGAVELPSDFFTGGIYREYLESWFSGYPFLKEYEDKKLEVVKMFLPYNPIIVEVGAYEGARTLELARHWPFGKIIAFEPNPFPFEKFLNNTRDVANISGYSLALDDHPGRGMLYFQPDVFDGDPSWEERATLLLPLGPLNYKIDVECVALEDWCEEHQIPRVDFLYIDVDDWAVPVLDGAVDVLKTVKVIFVKTHLSLLRGGPSLYYMLQSVLEQYGFELVAHWFQPGADGEAIFIKRSICEAVYR